MSLEQEIGRLADVLEKIEAKMGAPLVTVTKDELERENARTGTPAPVAKKATGKKAVTEPVVEEKGMTPEEFLKYCNTSLLAIAAVALRATKIGKIKNMLKKDYNAASIKAVPEESIAECKTKFDTIVGV